MLLSNHEQGVPFSIKGIQKGYPLCQNGIQKSYRMDHGTEPPHTKFSSEQTLQIRKALHTLMASGCILVIALCNAVDINVN